MFRKNLLSSILGRGLLLIFRTTLVIKYVTVRFYNPEVHSVNSYRRKNLKWQYILMVRTKYYSSTTMTRASRPRLQCRLPYMKGFIVDAISLLFRVHEWLCYLRYD